MITGFIICNILLFFIAGILMGNLLFKNKYLPYKQYWEKWEMYEGNYKSVREFAKLEDVSIKQRMEDIKRKVDYNNQL